MYLRIENFARRVLSKIESSKSEKKINDRKHRTQNGGPTTGFTKMQVDPAEKMPWNHGVIERDSCTCV